MTPIANGRAGQDECCCKTDGMCGGTAGCCVVCDGMRLRTGRMLKHTSGCSSGGAERQNAMEKIEIRMGTLQLGIPNG